MDYVLAHTAGENEVNNGLNYGHCGFDMPGAMGNIGSGGFFFGLFPLIAWVLFILVLIALFRWLWFKGNEEQKK